MKRLVLLFYCLPWSNPALATPFQRGVSLGLFSEDPLWSYKDLLREIVALSATHVELVVSYYQEHAGSTEIGLHPRFSATDEALIRTIREAHALGLKVMLFPIIRLSNPLKDGEWRGTLKPTNRELWWRSYSAMLLRVAAIARKERVELLSIGSELSTLDGERDKPLWSALVGLVRKQFPGILTYSGNWDHYEKVAIYDLVDILGVCGYFSLVKGGPTPSSYEEMTSTWTRLRTELLSFSVHRRRPLLFTELGYLSQVGAAAWPWAEGSKNPVDLGEQRKAYQAFLEVWKDTRIFAGVYFWNWYGWGGHTSTGYTPRNKPAAGLIRDYFKNQPMQKKE